MAMEPLSLIFRKFSALLSGTVLVFSDNFKRFAVVVEILPTQIMLPLIVGGLTACQTSALVVVVIV